MMVLAMREMEVDLAENGLVAVNLFEATNPVIMMHSQWICACRKWMVWKQRSYPEAFRGTMQRRFLSLSPDSKRFDEDVP